MAENNIMAMVGAFIAVAILLGVGTIILGNSTMDCSGLSGYRGTPESASTGWAGACVDSKVQSQSAYALLLITLIVIAAVVILSVVRML